ncbi:ATP-binding protein [Candidatus Bathyarchaeota archaeon A05DMB-2]|nr:ATP-binding protein [Candidatus Bathyarchaeota archaeon A05DMB-2]
MNNETFPRDILTDLTKWLDRKEAYAIKGPRQSGKTTILKILQEKLHGKNVVFLNFEDPDIIEAFETNPKQYIKSFMIASGKYYFLMDEYQYVKNAGKTLKLLYDTFENAKFIVTGSSSLELSDAMAKFLVGRVFFFELLQFNFHEFLIAKNPRLANIYSEKNNQIKEFIINGTILPIEKDPFQKEFAPLLNEYLIFGGYPALIKAADPETKKMILKNIYDTYISKDIIQFLKISDPTKYRCITRTLAAFTGKLLNYNEVSVTCQSYYKETKQTIATLAETYIIKLIQPFHRNPVTELKKNPKVYFFDMGLRNYIISNFNPIEKRTDAGAIIENHTFLCLRNSFPGQTINYWRTTAKAEVDFILRLNDELIPIEAKYQQFQKPKISRSLRSFLKTYQPKKALIVTKNFWCQEKIENTTVLFAPAHYI